MWRISSFVVVMAVVVLSCSQKAMAETSAWVRRVYEVQEGLPSNIINAIAQDLEGYLWLGTAKGLVRFDGNRFRVWGEYGEQALPAHDIRTLIAAADGSLWIGFNGTGIVSRIAKGKVINYPSPDARIVSYIPVLFEDSAGVMWTGGRAGLARLEGSTWEHVTTSEERPPAAVYSMLEDDRGTLWLGTAVGVFRKTSQEGTFHQMSSEVVHAFVQDPSGTIWMMNKTDVIKGVERGAPTVNNTPLIRLPEAVTAMLRDRHGRIWIGTASRIVQIPDTAASPATLKYVTEPGDLTSVVSFFEDKQGTVWAATRTGLVRFLPRNVTMITHDEGLPADTVRALAGRPDGGIWVGTVNGLAGRGGNETKFEVYPELVGKPVTALHADRSGRLWVAVDDGSRTSLWVSERWRARSGAKKFSPLPLPADVSLGTVFSMTSDVNGDLWFCHAGDTNLYRWHDGELEDFGSCASLFTDDKHRLWTSFGDGSLAVQADGEVRHFHHDGDSSPGGRACQVLETDDGVFWIATRNGLVRFKGGRFRTLTERNGLPAQNVTGIVEDNAGYFWLGLFSGIARVKRQELELALRDPTYRVRYKHFDESDGLASGPGCQGRPSTVRTEDGRLWFATDRGVAVIDPSRLPETNHTTVVRIERAVADNQVMLPHGNSLALPPRISTLVIEYTAVNLSRASNVRFAYRLDGYDRQWIEAGQRREAVYAALGPGQYEFRVRASMQGVPQAVAALGIAVEPAYYQRTSFLAGCIILMGLALAGIWRLRLRTLRREFTLILRERARIARELHDTILQSLAGSALQVEGIARSISGSLPTTADDLRRLRRQLECHIEEARDSVFSLRSPTLESKFLGTVLRQFAEEECARGRSCAVIVSGNPGPRTRAVEQELLRIAQEAVRNAFRHGQAEHVRIELSYLPESIRLRVVDDGIGFRPDATFTIKNRWGLLGMKERAMRVGGRLEVTSVPGRGTTVEAVVTKHVATTNHAEAVTDSYSLRRRP